MEEFFLALGLDPRGKYTLDHIKKAYRDLSKQHHPDAGGDPAMFRLIKHAYEMLTNPEYRDTEEKKHRKLPLDFVLSIPISFEEAFFGTEAVVSFNQLEMDEEAKVIVKKDLEVFAAVIQYPKGHMTGYEHVIPGAGLRHKDQLGNLILNFIVKQHPKFQCDGQNIIAVEKVDLELMVAGGILEVQTMYGIKEVRLWPGTVPGQQYKIKGCGVHHNYNHIVIVDPLFPNEGDLRKGDKFKGLDINWGPLDADRKAEEEAKRNNLLGYTLLIGGIHVSTTNS